jgi:integrase
LRARISKRVVDALRPGQLISDTEVRGFRARRLGGGLISYELRYGSGPARRFVKLGTHGNITPEQARTLAKQHAGEAAAGKDPASRRREARAAATHTLDALLDDFLARHVRKQEKALRSADEIERIFRATVRPVLGRRSIYDLRRRNITGLLDQIEDERGPTAADKALAYLRKCFRWHAARDDRFVPPIVPGMARTKPRERARDRTLADQELRDLDKALDALQPKTDVPACYPRFVRALLFSAQRRTEVAEMRWEEITGDTWVISGARYKTRRDVVMPLTDAMRQLLGPPQSQGFVFSSDGGLRAFSGYSKAKAALDAKIAELRKQEGRPPMPRWTHHDLRRSARSLMSRAGVSADIAERVLGHIIPGVRGVYDRHAYLDEKRDALEKLAALVERILHPPGAVVTFPNKPRQHKI